MALQSAFVLFFMAFRWIRPKTARRRQYVTWGKES